MSGRFWRDAAMLRDLRRLEELAVDSAARLIALRAAGASPEDCAFAGRAADRAEDERAWQQRRVTRRAEGWS